MRDEDGRQLLDLPDAPRPPADTPAPVRFLPEFDGLLLAHRDRRRIVADEHRPRIVTKNLRVRATFLFDGFVAGTWTAEVRRRAATLTLMPFTPLPAGAGAALQEEGEALIGFLAPDATSRAIRIDRVPHRGRSGRMLNHDLSGRVAAITGASSGIGEATALAFAGAGAKVALGARRTDRLETLVKRIEADGGTAVAIELDVAQEASARAFVTQAHEQLGGLDALVNNAGLMLLGPIEGADTEEWRRMIDVNLLGLLYCTHAALPLMREAGGGHVVNVSSVAGRFARAGAGVYNLTKFGVNAFSEALRQEALADGIRVTVVEPGMVETELQSHNSEAVRGELARRRDEMGEPLAADDIAEAILYAVSRPAHVSVSEVLVRPSRQAG